jgi:hypothetical protein
MTKISIQGKVTSITAKRVGDEVVIRKELKKAEVSEIHPVKSNRRVTGKQNPPAANRRINGKQKSPHLVTVDTRMMNDIAGATLEAQKKLKISEAARAEEQAATKRRDAAHKAAMKTEAQKATNKEKPTDQAIERRRIMNAETQNFKGNETTEEIKQKYAKLMKIKPKKGMPVPALK